MKKAVCVLLIALLMTGCGARETYETVADVPAVPAMAAPREISVRLPEDAVAPVLDGEGEQVYLCDDYEILVEILESGDLSETIKRLSGYDREKVTVMETFLDGTGRYEFVWACSGEEEDRIGRAVILDDGTYHYCLSVLRDASTTEGSQIVWEDIFASFTLV